MEGSRQRIPKVNSSRIANIAGENEPDISGVHTTTLHLKRSVVGFKWKLNDKRTMYLSAQETFPELVVH